jgi:hypothetical protein
VRPSVARAFLKHDYQAEFRPRRDDCGRRTEGQDDAGATLRDAGGRAGAPLDAARLGRRSRRKQRADQSGSDAKAPFLGGVHFLVREFRVDLREQLGQYDFERADWELR